MHGGIDGAFGHPTILNHHGVSSGASNRKSAALMAREGYFEFSARYPLAPTWTNPLRGRVAWVGGSVIFIGFGRGEAAV